MLRNVCFFALFAVAGLLFGAGGAFAHSNHHHPAAEAQVQHHAPSAAATFEAVDIAGAAVAGDWLQAAELPANPACPWQHCPDCGACCGCAASGGAALSQLDALTYPRGGGEERIAVPVRFDAHQTADDLARPPKFFA